MASLSLCIPGLLPPVTGLVKQDIPSIPCLEKILGHASRQRHDRQKFAGLLAGLFNLVPDESGDYPVAPLTHLLDDITEPGDIWMRADPVHLHADQHQLILLDQTMFNLDQHDALVLANEVRTLLEDHDMIFEAPVSDRWYIRLKDMPDVWTTPIHDVAGRDIHRFMPQGTGKNNWAKLLNEIQMTLHNHPVNIERRQRGELEVNSLWFWGCGHLPDNIVCEWSMICCDEEISRACAKIADIDCRELTESFNNLMHDVLETDDILVIMSFGLRHCQYQDIRGWQDFIAYLEECWFAGLLDALGSGQLEQLTIITEGQSFTINKSSFLKFWKRRKSILSYKSKSN